MLAMMVLHSLLSNLVIKLADGDHILGTVRYLVILMDICCWNVSWLDPYGEDDGNKLRRGNGPDDPLTTGGDIMKKIMAVVMIILLIPLATRADV